MWMWISITPAEAFLNARPSSQDKRECGCVVVCVVVFAFSHKVHCNLCNPAHISASTTQHNTTQQGTHTTQHNTTHMGRRQRRRATRLGSQSRAYTDVSTVMCTFRSWLHHHHGLKSKHMCAFDAGVFPNFGRGARAIRNIAGGDVLIAGRTKHAQ